MKVRVGADELRVRPAGAPLAARLGVDGVTSGRLRLEVAS